MRVAIRGLRGRKKLFEEEARLEQESDWSEYIHRLAGVPDRYYEQGKPQTIEIEFLDELDLAKRFIRFPVDVIQ